MRSRIFAIAFIALPLAAFFLPNAAMAQDRNQYEDDASTLMQKYRDHGDLSAFAEALCPSAGARADSLFSAIIALPQTDELVDDAASFWGGSTGRCKDERVDTWFRERISERRSIGSIGNVVLLHGLIGHRTPANVSLLMEFVLDTTRRLDEREHAHLSWAHALPVAERQRLFLDLLAANAALPSGHLYDEYHYLGVSGEPQFNALLMEALRMRPAGRHTADAVDWMAADAHGFRSIGKPRSWLPGFMALIDEFAGRSDIPSRLREASERARTRLAGGK